jgi:membrane dipeptidase
MINQFDSPTMKRSVFVSTGYLIIVSLVLLFESCQMARNSDISEHMQQANELSERLLLLDGHIDWPSRLIYRPSNVLIESSIGDFDVIRAGKGGLNAVMSVVYISPDIDIEEGRKMADNQIHTIDSLISGNPGLLAYAKTPEEVRLNFEKGLLSLPFVMENGAPIGDDLNYVDYLADKGFIYITLCHSITNKISDSSYDTNRAWNGLSPFGFEVIDKMNLEGIMVDVSHSSEKASIQAAMHSKAPVIASHSATQKYVPGYERNLSDTLIKLIASKGGIMMVNFGSSFIDATCKKSWDYLWNLKDSIGVSVWSPEGKTYVEEYSKSYQVYSNASRIADHIDHIVKIAGIDYAGLGSDFDGIGPSQPADVPDVSAYPNLIAELLERGYSEDDIEKVLSGNFLRVWEETLAISDSLKHL